MAKVASPTGLHDGQTGLCPKMPCSDGISLRKFCSEIEAGLSPRPTDSVLLRHHEALLTTKLEQRLAELGAFARLLSIGQHFLLLLRQLPRMAKALSIRIGFAQRQRRQNRKRRFFGARRYRQKPQLTLKGIAVAIADGMSGSEAGKEASIVVLQRFWRIITAHRDSWSVGKAGQKILSASNSWLHSQGQMKYASVKGMVSTLSVLVIKSNTAHIFHVGDSRIYLLRQNNLEQLTRDHRLWGEQR